MATVQPSKKTLDPDPEFAYIGPRKQRATAHHDRAIPPPTKESDTMAKTISIYDYELEVPEPYAEGHQLTAIEAKQLNQVFAENIANNQRSTFKKVKDGEEGAPTLDEAKAAFAAYAAQYQFTEASAGGGGRTMTPLQKEAKKIATQVVINLLAKSNRKRKDVAKDAFEAEVARIAETDKVLKIAAKNVKEMDSLASAEMENAA